MKIILHILESTCGTTARSNDPVAPGVAPALSPGDSATEKRGRARSGKILTPAVDKHPPPELLSLLIWQPLLFVMYASYERIDYIVGLSYLKSLFQY